MEKKNIWPILRMIILLVQLFFQSLCTTFVLRLDVLPGKYITLFLGAMVMLAVCTGLLVFLHIHGRIALWRKIISGILALTITLGCGAVFKFAMDAHNLVQDFTGNISDTRNTYVVVRSDDTAQSVKDTKNYRYGVLVDYDVEHTEQMLAVIKQQTGTAVTPAGYNQAALMVESLYGGEVDALIMNGVSLSLLIEQPGFENFLSRVRLLYTLPYQDTEKEDVETEKEEVDTEKESVEDPFVVYISGSDTRSTLLKVSRSDVNILAVVNPKTKQILLINTPRDYYVPNPAGKGALDKLTHCGNYGINCSIEALENLYDAEIDYYGQINFTGFEKLIDAIGGITVVAEHSFTAFSSHYFKKGENKVDGKKALAFARERYNVRDGDNARGKHQMQVITAVINKLSSSKTLIAKYSEILKSLDGMFTTNFTAEEISDLVKMQMNDMSPWNIKSYAVTGEGDFAETYSWKGQELYVSWPNEETVDYAKTLISRVLNGETLTTEDMTMPK